MLKNYDGGPDGGPLAFLICDGGSEFKNHFERGLEQCGCLQIVTDGASPWQNGRSERRGAWAKEGAEMEVNAGQSTLSDSE